MVSPKNKQAIPFDPEKPAITFGVRLGTTRGLGQAEVRRVGDLILQVIGALAAAGTERYAAVERRDLAEVRDIAARVPIYV